MTPPRIAHVGMNSVSAVDASDLHANTDVSNMPIQEKLETTPTRELSLVVNLDRYRVSVRLPSLNS